MTDRPIRSPAQRSRQTQSAASSASPLGLVALHLLEVWRRSKSHGLLFVAQDERRAEQLGAILHAFEPDAGVMVLPGLDTLPFEGMQPSRELRGRRASVLRRLAEAPDKVLLVATAEALIERVPAPAKALNSAMRLQPGDAFDERTVRHFLLHSGYSLDEPVEIPGSALLLGQVLEIFPAGALGPVRLDYRDGQVREIVAYDLQSQEALSQLDELVLDPILEWTPAAADSDRETTRKHGRPSASVFDYVPSASIIADFAVRSHVDGWFQHIQEASRDDREHFMSKIDWEASLRERGAKVLQKSASVEQPVARFFTSASPTRAFRGFLEQQRMLRRRIVFTGASGNDLRTMERRAGGASRPCASWRDIARARPGQLLSLTVDLDRGFFHARSNTTVVAAADLLGSRASRHDPMATAATSKIEKVDLAPGDVVIHIDRGLAILHGLETVAAPGMSEREMLRLEFAASDSVLVPISELASIWRYSSDPSAVSLDKADGSSWAKRRAEIEQEIGETAVHIAEFKTRRQALKAAKILPPVAEYERFVARFRYSATADQASAIEDVLRDLASGRPMNRLICGDVGYGKTEVALRAAAATALVGKQVAIVVPTTVLARQHVDTFRRRFAPFGIEIGHLSRFAGTAEARSVRKGLTDGTLRIVIGTHALASKTVRFADLGLLVIDEEQRFGQADKAKLRRLAEGLHLLTMTATPLPRTLAEAQAGFRDISVIATPPVRRAPVKTVVEPFDDSRVAGALRREHRRGGQSFVVCPRIEDIAPMERRLKALVAELTMRTVHGKMPAQEIDEAMMSFAEGKVDVLLTTNIVENGLDLPRANTILVWRPDRFGIAQLHQLRGRVGRGSTRAFALLLTDPDSAPSTAADKRLLTLSRERGAGAGFALSWDDMELRGRGDLFSERQSGHVKILGPSLYKHMLELALRPDGKPGSAVNAAPVLNMGVSGSLPKKVVQDDATRLGLYARISKCINERELDELRDEIEERFGQIPDEVDSLFETAGISLECRRLGVLAIDAGPASIAATLAAGLPNKLPKVAAAREKIEWKDGRLFYKRASNAADRLAAVRDLLGFVERCSAGPTERPASSPVEDQCA
jgi:transcription-repair coupling factor (superfamily II helicase)